jgi:macrolide transport system ATP-binding/permease protein
VNTQEQPNPQNQPNTHEPPNTHVLLPRSGLLAPSGMSVRDLAGEATAGLFARPARMMLTVVGTVFGLGALVATLGLSRTAGNRIVGRFDELAATEIVVSPKPSARNGIVAALPWDAPTRLMRLNGVAAAGNISVLSIGSQLVTASTVHDPSTQTNFKLVVAAASPGLFRAVRAHLRVGTLIDSMHSQRQERVAVLGPNAANRLGISRLDEPTGIAVGDDIFTVVGILDGVARQPELLGAVIIPEGTARRYYRLASPGTVVVETKIGAAKVIAAQIGIALRPDNPRSLKVISPPEPQRVRDAVKRDLNVLFLLLGGVSVVVGAIGIANATLVSVMERTGEIGLRRALGASRRHIGQQFLLESTAMGFVGGVLGASVGTLIVVIVAIHQSWTPVLDPVVPFVAPIIGAVTGLLSGTYPAIRASRLSPVDALRTGI